MGNPIQAAPETDEGTCWFHGEEPIPDDVYRVCLECGHAWTREALIVADAERRERRIDPDQIWSCPLCVHDF